MSAAEDAATMAKALKANAPNMGLTWNLRMATVSTTGDAGLTVKLDGDDAASTPAASTARPVPAISLIGATVVGTRVMTLWTPPNNLYIVGAPTGTAARTLTNHVYQQATADRTLTTTPQVIVGTEVTVSTVGAARWEATGMFDFAQTVAGNPSSLGSLVVDGVTQTALAVRTPGVSAVSRQLTPQQWVGSFAAGGTHTFELQASVAAASGTALARLLHTTILVKTYE